MAAQELHVSQPSISKAIKALEGELQVELMRKEGKHSILTHEGRLLQARIAPIIEELDALPGEIKNRENHSFERIVSGASPSRIDTGISREKSGHIF